MNQHLHLPIILANDADPLNYTPTLADAISPTDTVWFRRVVMDTGTPPITDISKPVQILVHTFISNNIVGNPDTICYNGNPPLIGQLMPDLIVPSTNYLFYMWQDSSSASTWKNIATGTAKEFDPADGLLNTTRYRRIVTSGTCVDTSHSVEMTVLPLITGNKIKIRPPADDSVCYGTQFNELIGAEVIGGGDNHVQVQMGKQLQLFCMGNRSRVYPTGIAYCLLFCRLKGSRKITTGFGELYIPATMMSVWISVIQFT